MSVPLNSPNNKSIYANWFIFIGERFPLTEHAITIFLLTLGNAVVACAVTSTIFHIYNFCIAYAVTMLFFFRLRCFDEVKDYTTDLSLNPDRPLARGLLTLANVKLMFLIITVIEICLVGLLGINMLLIHFAAIAYSYLMYKEFFIGQYLSPHLTTYALTHTFVSVLVAYSIFSQMTGQGAEHFTTELLILGSASWFIFNLYEFGRKTFSSVEERNNVPTYSSIFGIPGAILLSLSQVAASLLAILYLQQTSILFEAWDMYTFYLASVAPLIAGVIFFVLKNRVSAKIFRACCSFYLLAYFALFAYQGLITNSSFQIM